MTTLIRPMVIRPAVAPPVHHPSGAHAPVRVHREPPVMHNGVRLRQRPVLEYADMSPEEIRDFIASHKWRFASSMPWWPHFYVVRARCRDSDEFSRFVMHIRRHGYEHRFGKRTYIYFDWAEPDGQVYHYWTMGSPLWQTIIINRAKKKDAA